MSVPCTFLSFVMSVSVIFLYSKLVCKTSLRYKCTQNQILCNVCLLCIHLTCNVCPLYIPCLVCQYDLICKLVLCVKSVSLYIPLTCNVCMFTVDVHTKLVCSTGVLKTSLSTCVHKISLQYRCTQSQFKV